MAAVVSGTFVLGETLLQFLYAAFAGIATGIVVSWITRWALSATRDSFTEIAVTLPAPYVAWVIGGSIHASAVRGILRSGRAVDSCAMPGL